MTKSTGVGRGNNPRSHNNTRRGNQHHRWNSGQIISEHGYVKVRVGDWHWSSTQYSATNAWYQTCVVGYQDNATKGSKICARAVRRFLVGQ